MSDCNELKKSKKVNEDYLVFLKNQLKSLNNPESRLSKQDQDDLKKGLEFKILIREDKIHKLNKNISDCERK